MNFKQLFCGILMLVSSSSLMARDIDQVIQALAPYAGSAKRPFCELGSTGLEQGILKADVTWTRNGGGTYKARLTISGDELKAVDELHASPAVDAETAAAVLPSLKTLTEGPLVVTGVVRTADDRALVAYEQVPEGYDAPARFLAEILGLRSQPIARPYQPKAQDRKFLQELALIMARFQAQSLAARYDAMTAAARERGEEFPGPVGPVARLEVELRLARVTSRHLQKQTADESAVGFDPNLEWVQYMLPAVLSDNAVFVTLSKDGRYRLEDFN